MHYIVSILVQFILGERFRQIVTDFLAKLLKKSLKTKRSRQNKNKRDKKKRKDKQMDATIQEIQEELKSRIPDPENALIQKEGVKYFLSLDEAGLREVPGELSYCGLEKETFEEYKAFTTTPITSVRDIPSLGVKGAADLISNFMEWYFTRPPKRNFYALPPLLWNVVCNASFLAPAPTIARVQRLIGDPMPDGIWGSGTTARVTEFFENATVQKIVQFAKDFTELIKARYVELGERSPEFAETCGAWMERADSQVELLEAYILRESAKADAPPVNEAPVPTPEQQPEIATNEEAPVPPNLTTKEELDAGLQEQPPGATLDHLVAAIEKNNELTQELIDLQRQNQSAPEVGEASKEKETEDPNLVQTGAHAAKKVLETAEDLTETVTNPAGSAKKLLDKLL